MATTQYQPDPYQGWSVFPQYYGNVTAHEIMSDTSGRWACRLNLGFLRIYCATF